MADVAVSSGHADLSNHLEKRRERLVKEAGPEADMGRIEREIYGSSNRRND